MHIDWQRGSGRILDTEKLPEATHARAMQVLGDSIWLADERAPSLVEADWHGRLLGQYAVRGAFGGLAASRDGRFLYAAVEGSDVLDARTALVKAAFVDLSTLKLAAVDGIEIVEPGYIVLSSAERRELVLLRSPDLLFPAFERSRP